MLNEYLANNLLKQEMLKRDWFLQNCQKDDNWKGGTIPVPFRGGRASSVAFGSLTDAADIASSSYIRGTIDAYVEVWGSMVFHHRDFMDHSGKVNETSFLKILPGEIDDFSQYMKEVLSIQMGSGPHFAEMTSEVNAATGIVGVNRVERFELGQKVIWDDDNSNTPLVTYVTNIDVNTDLVTFSATRGGGGVNMTSYTVAQNAKAYHDGVTDGVGNYTTFVSLRQALLSAANGGAATLHNKTKTLYPYLQALNLDGASITPSNILEQLFSNYNIVRRKARGNANTVVMSFLWLGHAMAAVEARNGSYAVTKAPSASVYGWTEIEITSVKGTLKLVGIQEFDDDIIAYLDMTSFTFRSNGFIKKRVSPEGNEWYEVRATTGFSYVVDTSVFGEMEWTKPANNAIIHSIPTPS